MIFSNPASYTSDTATAVL